MLEVFIRERITYYKNFEYQTEAGQLLAERIVRQYEYELRKLGKEYIEEDD